jgi:hypothetical protein
VKRYYARLRLTFVGVGGDVPRQRWLIIDQEAKDSAGIPWAIFADTPMDGVTSLRKVQMAWIISEMRSLDAGEVPKRDDHAIREGI